MRYRFQTRILMMFLPLLLMVQGATIAVVINNTRHHITNQGREALIAIGSNFEQWLVDTGVRLADSSGILAADYGFRGAIGSRDIETIRTALLNAKARIKADEMMLIGLVGDILVDAGAETSDVRPFPNPVLLDQARGAGQSTALIELNGRIMQFVVVPVLAPDVIAWIGVGVEVDNAEAQRLKQQSTIPVEVTFAYSREGSRWIPAATTLMGVQVSELAGTLEPPAAHSGSDSAGAAVGEIELAGETYATSVEILNRAQPGARVGAIIQYSLNAVLDPYRQLFIFLIVVAVLGFVVSAVAALALARGMTWPIRVLDEAARRIRSGDYESTTTVNGPVEIERLADAFNAMVAGIAERERKIERSTLYDEFTGLPNRYSLERRLRELIESGERGGGFVLVLVNLENFTEIDNTLGHGLGDELLRDTARRLSDCLAQSGTLYLFARDKFVVLSEDTSDSVIDLVVGRVHLAVDAPFNISGVNIDVAVQVAAAKYPDHGADHRTLLRHLDIAIESARRSFGTYSMYDPATDPYTADRLALMSDLREGLGRGEIQLYYQPKVDLRTGAIEHAEGLLRWRHPRRGDISPDEFINLAERTGIIRALTRWALGTAIEDCRYWRDQGFAVKVGVNVSAKDLLDTSLPGFIVQELSRCGLSTDALTLEITESAVMEQPERALEVLKTLAAMGLHIAIDDFGTGQSSMAYVKQLPAKEIKIDKAFVLNLADNADDQKIVRTAIQLGRDFGMKITAEGVENAEAAEFLRVHGCDLAQGWHFARAMSKDGMTAMLMKSASAGIRPAASITKLAP